MSVQVLTHPVVPSVMVTSYVPGASTTGFCVSAPETILGPVQLKIGFEASVVTERVIVSSLHVRTPLVREQAGVIISCVTRTEQEEVQPVTPSVTSTT